MSSYGGVRPRTTRASSTNSTAPASNTTASNTTTSSAQRATRSKARRLITLATNITIILATLSLACVMVYPALQNWWKVRRDLQLLQVESQALIQRNDQIQMQIDALGTPEGIESRAREEFGWVLPGERAVNISGLPSHSSSTALPDGIVTGSVRPQIDWVTDTLDFIFGYEYPTPPPAPDDVIIGL